MGEKKKPTPEQLQAQDTKQIETQFGATDALERFATMMDDIGFGVGSGPGGFFGKTSFEEAQLNAMLDLVENSNPADLENAGDALVKAKSALNNAAKELADYVNKVEWKGEAAKEFQRFGTALAEHAYALGRFANAAGSQMKVASTGLTSVINSMPRERDTRLIAKKPEAFMLTPGKETNPEYTEAVKVEKNRQEAINQMNRLASFYAVSQASLAGQEAPKFPPMLKADVPPPSAGSSRRRVEAGDTASHVDASDSTSQQAAPRRAESTAATDTSRAEAIGTGTTVPDRNTSVEIDSVSAPPAPTQSTGVTPPTPTTGPVGPAAGPVPPGAGGLPNPVRGGVPQSKGTSGAPRTGGPRASAVGRSGTSGGSPAPAGRAGTVGRPGAAGTSQTGAGRAGPIGRPGTGGGPAATGRAGGPSTAGRTPMAGRPGTAGQPVAGREGKSGSGAPRAGRGGGIVGGTPQRSATGSAGSRIPRGTVIGGEGAATGRASAAKPSQSGVIGASGAKGAPRATGRGTPSANGVVGTPRSGATGSRPGARGFTAGGGGLQRARSGQRSDDDEQERTGSTRPDYLTEDEETWTARRRGAVPPVID
ncbi:hypothetical protein [Streptomyces sp. NBC_01481]|uniref:hypothetical protein n=1 Tax=Streptomyces sp. NBC_01481 TaxID=2975869 RepID=UPI00225273E0|nr:hypothetical protein [Streptomyces sp. NBC_01481]MCX4587786.1 hypothetical protein [Streptomyces sp. NBC_01481]